MLFSTENPQTVRYVPPRFLNNLNPWQKLKLSLSGFKETGERNKLGKAVTWGLDVFNPAFGAAYTYGSQAVAKKLMRKQDARGSLQNLDITKQQDALRLKTGIDTAAAVLGFATGNINLGTKAGASSIADITGLATNKPRYDQQGEYYPSVPSYGSGGKVKPTRQPSPLEPWQKVQLFRPMANKQDIMSVMYGPRYLGTLDMAVSDAEAFDNEMMNVRRELGAYKKGGTVSVSKAKEILRDGTVHGKKLTEQQRKYFGWIAGGSKPRKMEEGGEVNGERFMAIDQKTGAPAFTIDEGENVFDQQATDKIKKLAARKDYAALGRFVAHELREQPKNSTAMAQGGTASATGGLPDNITQMIMQYFPDDYQTALKIAEAESTYNTKAHNKNKNGSEDRGLFQINSIHEKELKDAGIIKSLSDLYDPETNIRAAAYIKANSPNPKHETGWEQWSTWNKVKDTIPQGGSAWGGGSANGGGGYSSTFSNHGLAPHPITLLGGEMGGGGAGSKDREEWGKKPLQIPSPDKRGLSMYNWTPLDLQLKLPDPIAMELPAPDMQRLPSQRGLTGTGYPMVTENRLGSIPVPEVENKSMNLDPEQLLNIAQLVTGVAGASRKLPEWKLPWEWHNYLNRVRELSYHGLTPQEQAMYRTGLDRSYAADVSNIRDISGGNGAFALGNMGAAINRYNRGIGEMSAADAALRRNNMAFYGGYLGKDIGYGRQIFEDKFANALADKQAAAQLAQQSGQQVFDLADYGKYYGKGSSWDKYLGAETERINTLNKTLPSMYTKWLNNTYGATPAAPVVTPFTPAAPAAPSTGSLPDMHAWINNAKQWNLNGWRMPGINTWSNGGSAWGGGSSAGTGSSVTW